jgi:N-acetylglucosamine-6-phosphate deacetylase
MKKYSILFFTTSGLCADNERYAQIRNQHSFSPSLLLCRMLKIELKAYYDIDNKPISVLIKNGKIIEVKKIPKLSKEHSDVYIAPGLIDNQVNGFEGIAFVGELTEAGVHKITSSLWERGVTTYFPTLITSSHEVLLKNFSILARAKNDKQNLGSIAGFHLEGPYISPENGFRGTHPEKYVRPPDWNEFMELYNASGKNIITVTVAPEVPGCLAFIKN